MRCSRTSLTTGIVRQHRDDMTVVTVFSNAVQKTKSYGDKNIVTIDTTVMGVENGTEKTSGNVKKLFTRKSAI